jgi:hypothetical protein
MVDWYLVQVETVAMVVGRDGVVDASGYLLIGLLEYLDSCVDFW